MEKEKPTIDRIIELFNNSKEYLALREEDVAERLNIESEEARKYLDKLLDNKTLIRLKGYYQLNALYKAFR